MSPYVPRLREELAAATLARLARPTAACGSLARRAVLAFMVQAVASGEAIPVQAAIAGELGISVRALQIALAELEDLDLVWVKQKGNGPARYLVMWDQLAAWLAEQEHGRGRSATVEAEAHTVRIANTVRLAPSANDPHEWGGDAQVVRSDGASPHARAAMSSSSSSLQSSSSPAAPSPPPFDDDVPPTLEWVKAMCLEDHGAQLRWTPGELRDEIAPHLADGLSRSEWRQAAMSSVKGDKPKAYMLECLRDLRRKREERLGAPSAGVVSMHDYARPWTGSGRGAP
ncbi:MAG: hypothetical protein IT303_11670 [Dehalococcoidia bacterium]|nr:hypothetical protein [Dehalococcoidia bacterium]